MDNKREMLRHCLATLAYRGGKVLRGVSDDFGSYRTSETSRTPAEILAHLADLLYWSFSIASGNQTFKESEVLAWQEGSDRFFDALAKFDGFLASDEPLAETEEKLFQGPIADALTHVGQLAMLRRMADAPIRGENYFMADIEAGRVGAGQKPARKEFD